MLAVLFGVASAYQKVVTSTKIAPVAEVQPVQPQPTNAVEVVNVPVVAQPAPVQVVNVTPEEAAAVASKVIGRTDLYSVEVTQFEGADVYLVTFSSRDLVYVSLDGHVVSISKLPVTVITQRRPGGGGNNDGGGNTPTTVTTTTGEDHEDHDEHEGGDD